jgi:hypothetical protein
VQLLGYTDLADWVYLGYTDLEDWVYDDLALPFAGLLGHSFLFYGTKQ